MALIRCAECKKDISDKAAACPHCGAPMSVAAVRSKSTDGGSRVLMWIGAIVFLLIAVRMCGSATGTDSTAKSAPSSTPQLTQAAAKPDPALLREWAPVIEDKTAPAIRRLGYANSIIESFPESPEAVKARELLSQLTALAENERTNGAWTYVVDEDAMTGKAVGRGSVISDNSLSLDFPYQGEQKGRLTIRHHPKWGKDVMVSIEKGQILCHTYDCRIVVRFDDEQPVTYTGTEPEDNSSELVFLPYAMAKRMEKAKRVRVQLTLFNNGSQVLEFNVKGFDVGRLKN